MNKPKKEVEIYTDGACSGNPGPGGWAAVLRWNGRERQMFGGEKSTTNNRMELIAVISALEALKVPCVVDIYTDSNYIVQAVNEGWAEGWRLRGWVKPDKKPALNADLWERLLELAARHETRFHWVKGHAENELNELCDRLAREQSQVYANTRP